MYKKFGDLYKLTLIKKIKKKRGKDGVNNIIAIRKIQVIQKRVHISSIKISPKE